MPRIIYAEIRANALTARDESAIRGLLETYGRNVPESYFVKRRDQAVVFAESGRAAIIYRVEIGVSLASGDPSAIRRRAR